ncbi:ATP-dependent Clp protease ATP-binding subunit [Helicovermis profundi]|uniref:ATP-dependent Clp protease ATP-binding subunit n=1 Tax=Helicovermis profundi TaxID=3065157 RepID=A0AAU9EN93_9FIRM|nr:ATP-dependent Clp protease ATP-binding subunit [Clostridia bacterium S502]
MEKCSVCKKNIAVVYTTVIEDGKKISKPLCFDCAKKMGIPIMDEMMKQMKVDPDDLENISSQMSKIFEDMNLSDSDEDPLSQMMNLAMGGDDFEILDKKEMQKETKEKIEDVKEDTRDEKIKKAKKKKLKNLEKFGSNLIDKARENKIDKVIGRKKEIDRVIQILNRRSKNNPVLIGEPGVGKTAIAEGLALRIVEKKVPIKLLNTEVYLLDMTSIVAGTQFRGQFEGRMNAIIKEAKIHGNVILVIDEVHNIMGAGEVHGGVMNAANILKPALAKGEVQIIGATTIDEYRKHIEKDAALERRFQPVMVDEPTIEESIEILKGIKSYYEDFHKVKISDIVIEEAVRMSEKYITDRFLPDKAIDVIDEAGSRLNLKNTSLVEYENLKNEIKKIAEEKEIASLHEEFERAAELKVHEIHLQEKLNECKMINEHLELTTEDVAYVIEAWTKIPVGKLTEEESIKLIDLENRLHKRVIGQNKAVSALSKAIRRNRSGFRKKKKPSSFIFVGPTGVGKTELARTLANELFGSEDALIRMDMSEYSEKHTISKLIGSPPGYVGYENGGQLTEKIRRRPYSVILLDEIEKAHSDVFNVLLQILEDGRLTDGQGRTVFFENAVIIMTSNAGTDIKANGIGFESNNYEKLEKKVLSALNQYFRPEFLNRVDDVVVFNHLSRKELELIADLLIEEVEEEVKEKGMSLSVDSASKEFLIKEGYDEKYGARPLRRTIQKYIEDEIAELFIKKEVIKGNLIKVVFKDGKICVEK